MSDTFAVTGELWRWQGEAAWHFVTLPAELADELRARYAGAHGAFGTLRVRATIGATTWSTSLFADRARDSYLLPVKADVRRRERVGEGDTVTVRLALAP